MPFALANKKNNRFAIASEELSLHGHKFLTDVKIYTTFILFTVESISEKGRAQPPEVQEFHGQINYNGNTDDNRHVGKHKNYQLVGLLGAAFASDGGDGESPLCHDHTMSPRDGFRSCL
jgi:hypothetical protein